MRTIDSYIYKFTACYLVRPLLRSTNDLLAHTDGIKYILYYIMYIHIVTTIIITTKPIFIVRITYNSDVKVRITRIYLRTSLFRFRCFHESERIRNFEEDFFHVPTYPKTADQN